MARCLTFACAAVLAAAAWGQGTLPIEGDALSLSAALDRAQTYEARYQAAQASFRSDREVLEQAQGALLPEVSASVSRTRNALDAAIGRQGPSALDYYSGGWALQLRQPLYRPEGAARLRQARWELQHVEAVLADERNRLAVEVTAAYLEIIRAAAETRSVQALQLSADAQAAASERAVPLGLASASEREEYRARAEIAGLRLLKAQTKLNEATRTLENMVGHPPVRALLAARLDDVQIALLEIEDAAVWQERAVAQAPAAQAGRAALEAAREGVERAKAGHKPTLDMIAARSKSSSDSFSSINNVYLNSSVGVQLNLPIYSGGRVESAIRQAVAHLDKAQAELDRALRDNALLVEREHAIVREARQRLRAYWAVIASAQQKLQAARAGVERGNRSRLDVLEAQAQLESARLEWTAALAEMLSARMRLEAAAGVIDARAFAILDRLLIDPFVVPARR